MPVDNFSFLLYAHVAGKVVSLQFERLCPNWVNALIDMEIDCTYSIPMVDRWSAEEIHALMDGARRAVVVSHMSADGDAVGSLTGMYALLRRILADKQAVITPILPDGCPEDLTWLPNADVIVDGGRQREQALQAIAEADLIVATDLSGLDRTGELAEAFRGATAHKVLIDHHVGPRREEFDLTVSDDGISSACELVYWTMRLAYGTQVFDLDAATSLYTGINTDTGSFSFSNTRQSVYLAVAELLTYGIDPHDINLNIKNVFTTARLQFFGYAMAHLLTVYPEREMALMVIRREDTARYGVESPELTGLVNEVMRLRDIDCAVLVREEHGRVRLSLRSKKTVDVNKLAREMFDGGGHERAAGATSHLTIDETVAVVKRKFGIE